MLIFPLCFVFNEDLVNKVSFNEPLHLNMWSFPPNLGKRGQIVIVTKKLTVISYAPTIL